MTLEALIRRDRAMAAAGLAAVVILAWLYLFRMPDRMQGMEMMPGMSMAEHAGPVDFLLTVVMWAVMMVAMMVPTAAPMILTFATINRRRGESGGPVVPTAVFVGGYLVIWFAFSLGAAALQSALQAAALLSAATMTVTPFVGAALLIVAGVYQVTPLKRACLARCQSPLGFILSEWRESARGAFVMGIRHGAFCVGCCWALMALLFVAGVMNLLWVATIAAFVFLEKLVPSERLVSWTAGAALVGWGAWLLVRTL